jgi:protein MpaA
VRRAVSIATLAVGVAFAGGACSVDDDATAREPLPVGSPPGGTSPVSTPPAVTDPPVTLPPTTVAPSTQPPPTQPPPTEPVSTPPGTDPPAPPADVAAAIDQLAPDVELVVGTSVEGRPITVVRRGTSGGTRVLVVGAIHGDEDAGTAIVDELRTLDVPSGVELWLVRSMNPDGNEHRQRHNANGVDLNRNFAHNWGPIAEPGNWEYAGPGPASEPETQAMSAVGAAVRPDLVLWYHQDLFRISPARGRDGEVRARYAELTGLPLVAVTGGTYTGTASQWSRTVASADGIGFTVELGSELTSEDARRHAAAVLTVASEL